jgi:glycosyltransferase involved in cell wall biosynthesis
MRVLCLSEHYLPRVGGTVNYVLETCSALAGLGVDVELAVPGPAPASAPNDRNYRVTWLDAGFPERGEPTRAQRYRFCSEADHLVSGRIREGAVNAVHVLFGLFLMEVLDTEAIGRAGARSVATVHNLPPMECARSWDGDRAGRRISEALRLRIVRSKNRRRLRRNPFSAYVTPSRQVKDALAPILPGRLIEVIGHGASADLLSRMRPPSTRRPPGGRLTLLTAGGWAPHKRQHLIPHVGRSLAHHGMSFSWTVAGPAGRVPGYREAVEARVRAAGLGASIRTLGAVPIDELARLYDAAHLYVQPSTEEGFCLTALDAAAAGLPVIASPAGALPEICRISGGLLTPSRPDTLAAAIRRFVHEDMWPAAAAEHSDRARSRFSWNDAALRLTALYSGSEGSPAPVA